MLATLHTAPTAEGNSMKGTRTLAALAAASALALTGCVMPPLAPAPESTFVQPADRPPPPSTTNHPHYDEERQCIRGYTCNNTSTSAVSGEDRFFDAIAGGFWIEDLPRTPQGEANGLDEATLETGYSMCPILAEEGGRELAAIMATSYLSDSETFKPEMPAMFLTAAEVYLCR